MRIAAYARYSTDQQREASLEDQLRNVRAYCARQSWPAPTVYSDAAISGARSDRPGYRRLLADAAQYDVILVDDLSRLSRDSVETAQAIRRLTFAGVRVIGVSDGVDTGRKGHKLEVGMRGIMSEMYLSDLADKTHRGLTGRALAGASAGGLPYGYRVTTTGQRAIDEAQAAVVRRIFADYLAGRTAREIAAALNAAGVPSARGSTWCASAIHGDTRRGIGILANPIYTGRQTWNRSRWEKHPDTGRRVRIERPASEWITTEHPELAIIDEATWDAAQARLRRQGHASPAPTRGGPGRPAKHLLSGILRCGRCGGPMTKVDRYRYGCATAKERGPAVCAGTLVPLREAEQAMLAGVREQLLSDAALQRFQRAAAAALKRAQPDLDQARSRLADAERVHANILAALRAGIITPSTRAELIAAEAAVSTARAALARQQQHQPATVLPRARDVLQRLADTLADHARNRPAVREALRDMLGDRAIARNENGATWIEVAPSSASADCQIALVAGGRSVLYLTEPIRIAIQPRKVPKDSRGGRR